MSIETQLAIKRNAEELSSYLKDLNSWTNEIKKKDVLAKKTKIKKNNYPPIRSTGRIDANSPPTSRPSSPIPEKVEKPVKNEVKKERIKSYDYRSWDKYNVEEELERLENEDFKEPKPMVEEKEEDEITQQTIELSLIEKEKGNVMFKKGNYKRAIQYYTKSKELDPTNPVFPLNRAMAYLKLKKYNEAENDCTDCIILAPKNVKALYRRGLARVGLKKYLEAKNDFEAAVVLEPTNKQAKDELNKVIAILKPKPKEEPKSSNNNINEIAPSKANQLKKKKSTITNEQEEKLKNKPIRRRLQIIEVGRTQEEIQKERDEELLKRMNKDIEEINEMMKNNDMLNDKQPPISLTETNKEESFSALDMVPVSTTKKADTNPKKQPKKMKIIEKGEENEDKEKVNEIKVNEENENENENEDKEKVNEIKVNEENENENEYEDNRIKKEKPKAQLKSFNAKEFEKEKSIQEIKMETEIKPIKKLETKESKDLLNTNNNSLLSSFIFNKENNEEEKKTEQQNQQKDSNKIIEQNKEKLNKKRSVVIEEIDEVIMKTKPSESLNKIVFGNENDKKEERQKMAPSIIEIIEEENKNDNKNKSVMEIVEENKIEEIKKEKEANNETKIENEMKKDQLSKSLSSSSSPSPSKIIRPKVKVATTMYEFERDWKSIKNDDVKTFEYLSSIIPENLPTLFKNSFESDYLTRILIIMNKFYIEESMLNEMYALLYSLQKVNRFEMTLMFMSRKDKQALKNIFDVMKSNQSSTYYSITDLEALAKKYKITL